MILDHKPHGAQVLKACNAGITEWLYCSPIDPAAGQAVCGGVPILFPQFGNCGTLPKHGFVRNIPWQLVHSYQGLEQVNVLYRLDLLNIVKPYWPYTAALELEAQITASILQITFRVTNLGPQPMPWTGGLHPYWKVACLQKTQLFGLLNMPQGFRFYSQGVEQLHQNVGPLYLESRCNSLKLQATGFSEWMVWNPGQAGATLISDLPEADWQNFVCVEPVFASKPIVLAKGERFEGTLKATWLT